MRGAGLAAAAECALCSQLFPVSSLTPLSRVTAGQRFSRLLHSHYLGPLSSRFSSSVINIRDSVHRLDVESPCPYLCLMLGFVTGPSESEDPLRQRSLLMSAGQKAVLHRALDSKGLSDSLLLY